MINLIMLLFSTLNVRKSLDLMIQSMFRVTVATKPMTLTVSFWKTLTWLKIDSVDTVVILWIQIWWVNSESTETILSQMSH